MEVQEKLTRLREIITSHAPLLVAYSGGVDSALLAFLAKETLGERMHCVIIDGPELPRRGLQEAITTAETYGLPLEIITGDSLSEQLMEKHPPDRCRHCKLGTFQVLEKARIHLGAAFIADGANASDLGEHRPGIDAFSSCGVIHPFIMASITKPDIREIARMKNLPFWDKPSSACLYSRIPYGEVITKEKLAMIEEAEDLLAGLGFRQVRVRHHGSIARIEILPGEFQSFISYAGLVADRLKAIGFSYITLDLRGYRSGSMDEVLPRG